MRRGRQDVAGGGNGFCRFCRSLLPSRAHGPCTQAGRAIGPGLAKNRAAHRQRSYSRALAGKVNNLRQLGTIVAMEVEAPQGAYLSVLGPRLMSFFRERNVLLRPLGNTVYVMPPYCISDEDLARVYTVIGEALEA